MVALGSILSAFVSRTSLPAVVIHWIQTTKTFLVHACKFHAANSAVTFIHNFWQAALKGMLAFADIPYVYFLVTAAFCRPIIHNLIWLGIAVQVLSWSRASWSICGGAWTNQQPALAQRCMIHPSQRSEPLLGQPILESLMNFRDQLLVRIVMMKTSGWISIPGIRDAKRKREGICMGWEWEFC